MFCPKCGTKNKHDDSFCVSCNAELIDNQSAVCQPTQKAVPIQIKQEPLKAKVSLVVKIKQLPAIAKILPIILVSLVIVGVVFFNIGASMTKPESIVKGYFNAIVKEDWKKALGFLLVEKSDFINEDSFADMIKEDENHGISNFEIIEELTSDSDLTKSYIVGYVLKGQSSPQTQTITLVKQNKKRFLVFNDYRISADNMVATDYQIQTLEDASVYVNDIQLIADNGVESDSLVTYTIPNIFFGLYALRIEHPEYKTHDAQLRIAEYGSREHRVSHLFLKNSDNNESSEVPKDSIDTAQLGEKRGNTIGNILNRGIAATDGEWIYYAYSDDTYGMEYDDSFYYFCKFRMDGTKEQLIANGHASNINVVDDWIYYYGYTDSWDAQGIYKMRTDGTDRTKLNVGDSNNINDMSIVDDWIYYTAFEYNHDERGYEYSSSTYSVYKMKKDGSDIQLIDSGSDGYGNLIVTNDWIYYISGKFNQNNNSYSSEIFKMKTDGSAKQSILSGISGHIGIINITDDWIYYTEIDYPSSDNHALYKIRTDGLEKQLIYNNEYMMNDINIVGDWIYYTKGNLEFKYDDSGLYKMRIDGSKKQLLAKGFMSSVNVVGDWVYYYSILHFEGGEACRIRTDGSESQRLDGGQISTIDFMPDIISPKNQITNRTVKNGDRVNIDYVGSIDGVEFDGGNTRTWNNNGINIIVGGEGFMLPSNDFSTQIIGHSPGDIVEIYVTFPNDYYQENLTGKVALFITTINFIIRDN